VHFENGGHKNGHKGTLEKGFPEEVRLQAIEKKGSSGRTRTYNPPVNSWGGATSASYYTYLRLSKTPVFMRLSAMCDYYQFLQFSTWGPRYSLRYELLMSSSHWGINGPEAYRFNIQTSAI